MAAVGGQAPYTYAVVVGSLPTGLTLNSTTGVISGTPTAAGSFNFTIKVTDHVGATALSSCSSSCGTNVVEWDFNLPTGNVGTTQTYTVNGIAITAYGYTNSGNATQLYGVASSSGDQLGLGIASVSGHQIDVNNFVQLDLGNVIAKGATNGQIIVGSVQPGDSYNIYGSNTLGSIGVLLGSPNQTADLSGVPIPSFGTYPVHLNACARRATTCCWLGVNFSLGNCKIYISPAINLRSAAPCGSDKGYVGKAMTSDLAVTGGTGPFTYQIISGALPNGLTLNTSTGNISGTPTTAGTFTFTSQVTDAYGNTDTATCTIIIIAPPIDLECGTCGANKAYVGQAFSDRLPVSPAVRVRLLSRSFWDRCRRD